MTIAVPAGNPAGHHRPRRLRRPRPAHRPLRRGGPLRPVRPRGPGVRRRHPLPRQPTNPTCAPCSPRSPPGNWTPASSTSPTSPRRRRGRGRRHPRRSTRWRPPTPSPCSPTPASPDVAAAVRRLRALCRQGQAILAALRLPGSVSGRDRLPAPPRAVAAPRGLLVLAAVGLALFVAAPRRPAGPRPLVPPRQPDHQPGGGRCPAALPDLLGGRRRPGGRPRRPPGLGPGPPRVPRAGAGARPGHPPPGAAPGGGRGRPAPRLRAPRPHRRAALRGHRPAPPLLDLGGDPGQHLRGHAVPGDHRRGRPAPPRPPLRRGRRHPRAPAGGGSSPG